jgi:hypothetical protein
VALDVRGLDRRAYLVGGERGERKLGGVEDDLLGLLDVFVTNDGLDRCVGVVYQ